MRCLQNPTKADEMIYSKLNSDTHRSDSERKQRARQWLSNKCQKRDTFYALHMHALNRTVCQYGWFLREFRLKYPVQEFITCQNEILSLLFVQQCIISWHFWQSIRLKMCILFTQQIEATVWLSIPNIMCYVYRQCA